MTLYELFVKITGDSSSLTKATKDGEQAVSKFGQTTAAVGKQLVGALGLAAIGTSAISAAKKFEDAGIAIARSTGATGEKLDALQKSFSNVYGKTAAGAEQITAALSNLSARTGATGKDLEDLTLKMLKLAKAQGEDVTQLTPLVTRVFGDWSVATRDQTKAMDYLRATSQQTGTTVARLSEQVVYAGAPLRMLGYTFEQSAALIGRFEKEGVNVELVLGGMKAALQKFAKDGVADPAKAWREFVDGVKSGAVSLSDAIQLLGAKRGPDTYRAIIEGRFEIDELVKSTKKLADEGGASLTSWATKLKIYQHQIETWVAANSNLIVAGAVIAPLITKIGSSAIAAGPALATLAAKTELWVAGMGLASTSYSIMLASGVLRVAGWVGLAVAIGTVISKYWDLKDAQNAAAKQEDQRMASQQRLEKYLQGRGVDITEIQRVYNRGQLGERGGTGYDEYLRQLQRLAKDLPPVTDATKKSAAATKDAGEQAEKTAKQLRDMEQAYFAMIDRYDAEARELARSTVEAHAHEKAAEGMSRGLDAAATAVHKFLTAGEAWGEKVPLDEGFRRSAIAAAEFQREIDKFKAPEQLDVDWSKVSRGTALETITRPGSSVDLRRQAELAAAEAQRIRDMWQEGKATQIDYENAQKAADEAERRATNTTREHTRAQSELGREVTKAFDHMRRGIADAIVEWKGFGETALSVIKELAKGILEILIGKALKALSGALLDNIDKTKGLAKVLTDALGIGSGAAKSAGSASGAAGGGISSGIGAGASGVVGIVGAVGSVVSAISSVIGNFQFAGMNKTLDLIENYTRYTKIYTGEQADSLLETSHRIFAKTDQIRSYLWDVQSVYLQKICAAVEGGTPVMAAGGGGGAIYFQHCTFGAGLTQSSVDDMMRTAYERARVAAG